MSHDAPLRRTASILGAGTYPMGVIPRLIDTCSMLAIHDRLLAVGVAEFNRGTLQSLTPNRRDLLDLSPDPREIGTVAGFLGDEALAEAQRPNWEGALHALVNRLIAAHRGQGLSDGQGLWLQSWSSGHTPLGEA